MGAIVDSVLPSDSWIRLDCEDDFVPTVPSEMAMHMSGAYDGAPRCNECGGLLKPDAVYFGEELDEKTLLRANRLVEKAKCMVVIGTNCSVAPASKMPISVKRRGGTVIEVNPGRSAISDAV